jgi:hypothetical protein
MREDISRSLTTEVDVERLLRESADSSLFGLPPRNLVEQAMAAIAVDEPCEQPRGPVHSRGPALLIVLSFAAAGLFIAALPHSNGRHRMYAVSNLPIQSTVRSPLDNQVDIHGKLAMSQSNLQPGESAANSSTIETFRSNAIASSGRRRAENELVMQQRAPKAIWKTTVVSESEQGVVLPVVTMASNSEDEPDGQGQTGLAIVPLQSTGLTTAEYTGPSQ